MAADAATVGVVRVTLAEDARAAGVSESTDSRAVNGSVTKVGDRRAEAARQAAKDLGYMPNASAQAVAHNVFPAIAMLVPDLEDAYFATLVGCAARAAQTSGLSVSVMLTSRSAAAEVSALRTTRSLSPRGVILATPLTDTEEVRWELSRLRGQGTRVVTIGDVNTGPDNIPIDNFGGAASLGRYLAGCGYRHSFVLASEPAAPASVQRVRGFRRGFEDRGGTVHGLYHADFDRLGGYQAMQDAIHDGVPPGCLVFAVSDAMATGAAEAIRDSGRTVGVEIALAGFGNTQPQPTEDFALTTVDVSPSRIGTSAVQAILRDDLRSPGDTTRFELLIRQSTPRR